jgi:hypothetical protein
MRSSVSDAALADDNLLRIHEWAARWDANVNIVRVAEHCARPERRVIVLLERGIGGPVLPVSGHVRDDYDAGRGYSFPGATDGEAFGSAWDALAELPAAPRGEQNDG